MRRRHHVYILSCRDDYLYTGYTVSLRRRLSQHRKGIGSKFTRSHLPVRLVYSESYGTRAEALKREIAIKRFPRYKKVLLISSAKRTLGRYKRQTSPQKSNPDSEIWNPEKQATEMWRQERKVV